MFISLFCFIPSPCVFANVVATIMQWCPAAWIVIIASGHLGTYPAPMLTNLIFLFESIFVVMRLLANITDLLLKYSTTLQHSYSTDPTGDKGATEPHAG